MDFEKDISGLVRAGFALHWLRRESKAPVNDGWSTAPVETEAELRESFNNHLNVGVRPGEYSRVGDFYLHLIDLDIRNTAKTAEAMAKLREFYPNVDLLPYVISGSGGDSRHFYFLTNQPFRSRKLAVSDAFEMVWDAKKDREVKKRDWEIELFGTGKQAALPPSIHPDTKKPYVWGRPIDLEDIAIGMGPIIPASVVETWVPSRTTETPTEVAPVLGMSIVEAQRVLKDLPLDEWCEDHDGWFKVGMALHHEYKGSAEGLKLWKEFSKQSTKFDDKHHTYRWGTFGDKPVSVRMATLIDAAKKARIARIDDDFDEEDDEPEAAAAEDDDDLLGEVHTPTDSEDDDLLGPVSGTKAPAAAEDREWEQLLDWSDGEKPAIKSTLHNIQLILQNDVRFKGIIRYNELLQTTVFFGKPGIYRRGRVRETSKPKKQLNDAIWNLEDPVNGDRWTDDKDIVIRDILSTPKTQGGWNLKPAKQDVHDAVEVVGKRNRFHPVRDYLSSLTWDGVPRMERMFIDWLKADDTAYHREVATLVLLGAVTRAFEPGHKFDFVAILEGVQGKRKSTWIERLGKSWFAELHGDFGDTKGMVERMQGYWILELPELQGFTKGEIQDIKAFCSAKADNTRLSYDRRAQKFKRGCIFLGSTNDLEYLKDNTGGRRFWPIFCHVDSIDIDGFEAVVDQLWAEALTLYREHRAAKPYGDLPLYLRNEKAIEQALELQESRRAETAEDGVAGRIGAWLDRPVYGDFDDPLLDGAEPELRQETCLMEIWVECLGNDLRFYDGKASQSLRNSMRFVRGWVRAGSRQRTEKYGQQRVYHRVD